MLSPSSPGWTCSASKINASNYLDGADVHKTSASIQRPGGEKFLPPGLDQGGYLLCHCIKGLTVNDKMTVILLFASGTCHTSGEKQRFLSHTECFAEAGQGRPDGRAKREGIQLQRMLGIQDEKSFCLSPGCQESQDKS